MTGSPLVGVSHFRIPSTLLDATLEVLYRAGLAGDEAFVVWGGVVSGNTIDFVSYRVPEQTRHQLPSGLLVTVEGDALHALNRELYRAGEVLAGQVHSHPTAAYHSDTDDHFPLVTLTGALSLVVPYFARGGRADIRDWAWYRLVGQGKWAELTRTDRVEILAGK